MIQGNVAKTFDLINDMEGGYEQIRSDKETCP